MSQYNRGDRLFILAKVCCANNLTPDDTAYMKLIIGVCTSKLGASNDAARQYAEDLTSAYRFDKWSSILTGSNTEASTAQETPSNMTEQSETQTPTLNTYKTFTLKMPCTPIKTLSPKPNAALETSPTDRTQAHILFALAQHDILNGVGRITLSQARYELEDKSLTVNDVLRLLRSHIKNCEFESRPGNIINFYFDGKDVVKSNRPITIQPSTPVMYPTIEYKQDRPLPKQDGIAEEILDDEGAVDDEEGITDAE
jgi:hypothetical protein